MNRQAATATDNTPARAPAIDIERVLTIAADLFAEHGFDGVSTREIAKACDCRLPSIYYHFGDKRSLYHEAFTNKLEDTIDSIRQRTDSKEQPRERLCELSAAFFDLFTRDRTLLLLVQRDIVEASIPGHPLLCRRQHEYFLNFIGDLISGVVGHRADDNSVMIVHGLLLGYCEFYMLCRETAAGVTSTPDIEALQEAVLRILC